MAPKPDPTTLVAGNPGAYDRFMLESSVNAEIPVGESNGREVKQALSPREHEVMHVISLGLTNREAAEQLSVSVHAVKFHLASIYRKLDVSNRTEAVVTFLSAQ